MERRLADLKAANRRREAQLRARKQHLEAAEQARERNPSSSLFAGIRVISAICGFG